jgi:alpha-ketoglutarate-dependent taurine dioxygenase
LTDAVAVRGAGRKGYRMDIIDRLRDCSVTVGRSRDGHTAIPRVALDGGPPGWRTWLRGHVPVLRELLRHYGAVVVAQTGAATPGCLGAVATAVGGTLLEYRERSTPRSTVAGRVYTSTEYPPDEAIPLHNENSYADSWPEHLFLLCLTPPASGGQTPVADSRAVLQLLPADLVARFREHGVRYTRTYHEGLGLPWQEVFQTSEPAVVDEYCRAHDIEVRWDEGLLQTSQRRPAVTVHPVTGEEVWFNQAHLFHASSLSSELFSTLLATVGEGQLPRHAHYGNGDPITAEEVATIVDAYRSATVSEDWRSGDLLMLDNLLMSHGRAPYRGERSVVVAMTGAAAGAADPSRTEVG